jgi:hypothetical protein
VSYSRRPSGIADKDVFRRGSRATRLWRCCEFIAWKCDLVGGGKETANFLHRGDKCRKEEALSVGLRRIHEAERGTGVT